MQCAIAVYTAYVVHLATILFLTRLCRCFVLPVIQLLHIFLDTVMCVYRTLKSFDPRFSLPKLQEDITRLFRLFVYLSRFAGTNFNKPKWLDMFNWIQYARVLVCVRMCVCVCMCVFLGVRVCVYVHIHVIMSVL